MDLWNDLFNPAMTLLLDWLRITVTFAGVTIPIWAFFAFAILIGLFVRLIEFIGGVRIDSGDDGGDIHNFHIGGFGG